MIIYRRFVVVLSKGIYENVQIVTDYFWRTFSK